MRWRVLLSFDRTVYAGLKAITGRQWHKLEITASHRQECKTDFGGWILRVNLRVQIGTPYHITYNENGTDRLPSRCSAI